MNRPDRLGNYHSGSASTGWWHRVAPSFRHHRCIVACARTPAPCLHISSIGWCDRRVQKPLVPRGAWSTGLRSAQNDLIATPTPTLIAFRGYPPLFLNEIVFRELAEGAGCSSTTHRLLPCGLGREITPQALYEWRQSQGHLHNHVLTYPRHFLTRIQLRQIGFGSYKNSLGRVHKMFSVT